MAQEYLRSDGQTRSAAQIAREMGTDILRVNAATITVNESWHGRLVVFEAACTVTIPSGLRSDFSCGWEQNAAGVITFAAGGGLTLQSFGGKLSSGGQYAFGAIIALALNDFRLSGNLA